MSISSVNFGSQFEIKSCQGRGRSRSRQPGDIRDALSQLGIQADEGGIETRQGKVVFRTFDEAFKRIYAALKEGGLNFTSTPKTGLHPKLNVNA